jgi:hypothetical protein
MLQYDLVQAKGNLRFPWLRLDDGAPPGAGKVDITIAGSWGLLHKVSVYT